MQLIDSIDLTLLGQLFFIIAYFELAQNMYSLP